MDSAPVVDCCNACHMNVHTGHDHRDLLDSLTDGKLPRNLNWSTVVELIGKIGEVQAHGNDEFAFVVGAKREFFKRSTSHNLEVAEIARLRRFLKDAMDSTDAPRVSGTGRMVVAVDHHAAHIFHDLSGQPSADEETIRPYDPFKFQHHLVHRKEAHYKGEHVPEENSFYEEIAKDIVPAKSIVLIGHATGKSSAVEFLSKYLQKHHPETFHKIVATEMADLSALTEPEIEKLAREHSPIDVVVTA